MCFHLYQLFMIEINFDFFTGINMDEKGFPK